MDHVAKPYVPVSINAVDTVSFDPAGRDDAARSGRYTAFGEARDVALFCIEAMLDEGDYGDEHGKVLEMMLGLLESARCFEDLAG